MEHPIGLESSLSAAVSLQVVLPWGNNLEVEQLSSEYLIETNFLANQVFRFTTLKASDPDWFIGPVPYVVRTAETEENQLTLTLQNPTSLVSQGGGVIQGAFTDQNFPELPRTVT